MPQGDRQQEQKYRDPIEMDLMSEYENIDVLLGSENANPVERELANTINISISNKGT